jgi:hypothetical protein
VSSGAPTSARSATGSRTEHSHRGPRGTFDRAADLLTSGAPWLIALAVYAAVAVITTWPIGGDLTGTVFGAPGDITGNITLLRYRNELGVGPLSNAVTPQEAAPFGLSLPGAISLPQIVIEGPAQLVGAITGSEVLAVNLVIISGLTLTAFTCFVLCMWITGNPWASGVAGLGYGFNPWILERAHGHIHFTHLWALPLIVLALMWIRRDGGRRAWALFVLATVAACYTNTYISLFAAVIIGGFIVADLAAGAVRRSTARVRAAFARGSFALAVLVAVMIPQMVVSVTQASTIDSLLVGTRSPQDLYTYGSRWWEWITPSYRNPLYDQWTAPFLAARQHGSNFGETTIYLGGITILLALAGIALTVHRRRAGRPAWPGAVGISLVACGVLVSLPKTISPLGFDIPMPAAVLSQVVEPWRVYARLFAVVALGAAILAAIGLTWALGRLPRRGAPLAAVALGVLVLVDLNITSTSFSAEPTPVYRALGAQPGDDPRVEYPLTPPVQAPHLAYIFYTEAAGRPLVNGGRSGTPSGSFSGRLADPTAPETAPALAGLGARWAVLHSHIYGGPPPRLGAGYRLVGDFAGSLLYEITAGAPALMAVPGGGFGAAEPAGDARYDQWMAGSRGTIAIVNTTAEARPATLRFTATSFVTPRDMRISLDDDVIETTRVASQPTRMRVDVPAVPPGLTELDVTVSPGAYAIAPILGNSDPRSVSVKLSGITVTSPGQPPFRVG